MADEVGSVSMAGAREQAPKIGIGMLGYAFMGKAHTKTFIKERPLAVGYGTGRVDVDDAFGGVC